MATKRGNGEGSAPYKRKDGRWCARYTVHTPAGSKRKPVYGRTRAEAAEKLAKALADREGSRFTFDAKNLTVGGYLTRWLEHNVQGSVRPITYESYERLVRVHVTPALGYLKLKALAPPHVRALYRSKLEDGLAPRTVQYIHAVLNRALKAAVSDGLIPRNVCKDVGSPRVQREEMQYLTREEVRAFFEAASEDRLEALYVLAVTTGLRQGELLGLKWEDVDFEAGKVSVQGTLSAAKKGPMFNSPKRNKSRRNVTLASLAIEALKAHRERQSEEREKLDGLWQDHGLVFASTTGTPLNRHNVFGRSFKPLLNKAGLPHTVRFHDLRHTCATLLCSKNVNPKVVQEMLGHANISQTMDIYSHVLPNMQDEAATAMESALT
jgi:integrase